ncbi:hypothetical protein V6N12_038763 [Hibiscus sabdariffa]|uniref:Uncharacterized protein n=1 Tax=Hibiscus sabdariffa TaxID=183260 RepID=A0ABR2CBM2_9ROSI
MPNDWHNLLEVPGNRLPETGSRQMNFCILEVPGNRLPNTGSNMAEDFIQKKNTRTWNPSSNLKLIRLEARFVKQLKRLRHYNSNIGNFQVKIYARNDQPGRIGKQQHFME